MVISVIDIAIFLTAFLVALYYYAMKPYNYFKNTKIKYVKPTFPIIGSMEDIIFRRGDIITFFKKGYELFPNEK